MIVDDVLHKISCIKWLKMASKSELLVFVNTSFQPLFSVILRFLKMFFRVQPSLTNIFDVFLRCNHRNDFFPTILIVVANDDHQRSFAQVYCTLLYCVCRMAGCICRLVTVIGLTTGHWPPLARTLCTYWQVRMIRYSQLCTLESYQDSSDPVSDSISRKSLHQHQTPTALHRTAQEG